MVRKVDKTKLLTVVGIIIFLFGGAVRIFSHFTSSADNYIENFDVIIFSGLIIGWGVSVAYRIVQNNGIAISFFFIGCGDTMPIDPIDPDDGLRNLDFFQEFIGKLTDKSLCLHPVATTY